MCQGLGQKKHDEISEIDRINLEVELLGVGQDPSPLVGEQVLGPHGMTIVRI